MANIFQKISVPKVHFSNFNLTHEYKCSMDAGYLIPINCVECLPNDTWQGSTEAFIRLAPTLFPPMHRVSAKTYTFFVPNRIIWKYWPEFIAESGEDVAPAALTFQYPQVKLTQVEYPLIDYLGMPNVYKQSSTVAEKFSLLPFLAYQKIWNDYFRDENLQEDLFEKDDGKLWQLSQKQGDFLDRSNFVDALILRKKAWEKDYFTSALPEPQLGDPVPVPVNGEVMVDRGGGIIEIQDGLLYLRRPLANASTAIQGTKSIDGKFDGSTAGSLSTDNTNQVAIDFLSGTPSGQIATDAVRGLSVHNASFSINDLRLASAIQRFNELLARAGHRYKETILSMFNQVTPDYRLDRPEFICSSNIPVQFSDIPQTSSSVENSPQGTLAGKGTVYGNNGLFRYHCNEHGFLITLCCVIPRTSYMNGVPRMFFREDRYDYYTPAFENLGEQAIYNKELYFDASSDDEEVFGYGPRYAEYKYIPSTVHGEFRDSLSFMTFVRKFGARPHLNEEFITPDDGTLSAPFAVTSGVHHYYCQFVNHLYARRPMQKLPIPKLV